MPVGRYVVMDGDGAPVGTESFRCAPGPIGWRYFGEIATDVPDPHHETVDLVVDDAWLPVRMRIATGSHELLLSAEGDRFRGHLDGEPLDLERSPDLHVDYLSPVFNAMTVRRLTVDSTEIDVWYFDPVTIVPSRQRQRYEALGVADVATPVGTFAGATRWRYTSIGDGYTSELAVAGDIVIAYDGLFALEWYEPGASGATPGAPPEAPPRRAT